jgi:hypothetical protein
MDFPKDEIKRRNIIERCPKEISSGRQSLQPVTTQSRGKWLYLLPQTEFSFPDTSFPSPHSAMENK